MDKKPVFFKLIYIPIYNNFIPFIFFLDTVKNGFITGYSMKTSYINYRIDHALKLIDSEEQHPDLLLLFPDIETINNPFEYLVDNHIPTY